MTTPLLIVDDEPAATQRLCPKSEDYGFTCISHPQHIGFIDNKEKFEDLLKWLKGIKVDGYPDLPENLAVVLDLNLYGREKGTRDLDSIVAQEFDSNWQEVGASGIDKQCYSGLAVLRLLLESSVGNLGIVVASSADPEGRFGNVIEGIRSAHPARRMFLEHGKTVAISDLKYSLLKLLQSKWKETFFETFHNDESIQTLLSLYGTPWITQKPRPGWMWTHDDIENGEDVAGREFSGVLESANASAIKSLCMSSVSSGKGDLMPLIFNAQSEPGRPRSRPISARNIESVARKCKIPLMIEGRPDDGFQFPISPGIAFLCSLKELYNSLAPDQEHCQLVMRKLSHVGYGNKADVFELEVRLSKSHKGEAVSAMQHILKCIEEGWAIKGKAGQRGTPCY